MNPADVSGGPVSRPGIQGAGRPRAGPPGATAPLIFAVAAVALILAFAHLESGSARTTSLAAIGVALGCTLFLSNFGFAGSFRAAIQRSDWSGFRAQALALAVSSVLFFPLLAQGEILGTPLNGFGSPVGVSFIVGAVLFGIGMQIGGGCASGTLFLLGGGDLNLLVTLAFFVVGSVLGAASLDLWWGLPALDLGSTQDAIGWPAALALHLGIFALVIWKAPRPAGSPPLAIVAGVTPGRSWSLARGALVLAALNGLTLVLAGRPWGETSGFTLWGSKVAAWAGLHPGAWPYWQGNPEGLATSVFADVTSVMDLGIIAGAALAAAAGGRFALRWRLSLPALAGAALGGVLMGYGARLSGGCNIGSYFSALASGSLSGWVWPAAAFLGSIVGLRLQAIFGRADRTSGTTPATQS
jgi:uncharacterized protein